MKKMSLHANFHQNRSIKNVLEYFCVKVVIYALGRPFNYMNNLCFHYVDILENILGFI